MALVAYFDLELHQMDVKTTFLNGHLHKEIYMQQLEGFKENGKEHLGVHVKEIHLWFKASFSTMVLEV